MTHFYKPPHQKNGNNFLDLYKCLKLKLWPELVNCFATEQKEVKLKRMMQVDDMSLPTIYT